MTDPEILALLAASPRDLRNAEALVAENDDQTILLRELRLAVARAYADDGDINWARALVEQNLSIWPRHEASRSLRVTLYVEENRYEEALLALQVLTRFCVDQDLPALCTLGRHLCETDRAGLGAVYLGVVARRAPDLMSAETRELQERAKQQRVQPTPPPEDDQAREVVRVLTHTAGAPVANAADVVHALFARLENDLDKVAAEAVLTILREHWGSLEDSIPYSHATLMWVGAAVEAIVPRTPLVRRWIASEHAELRQFAYELFGILNDWRDLTNLGPNGEPWMSDFRAVESSLTATFRDLDRRDRLLACQVFSLELPDQSGHIVETISTALADGVSEDDVELILWRLPGHSMWERGRTIGTHEETTAVVRSLLSQDNHVLLDGGLRMAAAVPNPEWADRLRAIIGGDVDADRAYALTSLDAIDLHDDDELVVESICDDDNRVALAAITAANRRELIAPTRFLVALASGTHGTIARAALERLRTLAVTDAPRVTGLLELGEAPPPHIRALVKTLGQL